MTRLDIHPYSVLVIYPPGDTLENMTRTFWAHVFAENPAEAGSIAARIVIANNDWEGQHTEDDIAILLVIEGHHEDVSGIRDESGKGDSGP